MKLSFSVTRKHEKNKEEKRIREEKGGDANR